MTTDADIRPALLELLRERHIDDDSCRIYCEYGLRLGERRIDVLVLNGRMEGFEIKSDRDTLDRLEHQADIYNQVLDTVTLVVGRRHLETARSVVPKWWGIIVAESIDGIVELRQARRAKPNSHADAASLALLLSRNEAIAVLRKYDAHRGLSGALAIDVRARLSSAVPPKKLKEHVRGLLKERGRSAMRSVPSSD